VKKEKRKRERDRAKRDAYQLLYCPIRMRSIHVLKKLHQDKRYQSEILERRRRSDGEREDRGEWEEC
jgi:hypothetical protein